MHSFQRKWFVSQLVIWTSFFFIHSCKQIAKKKAAGQSQNQSLGLDSSSTEGEDLPLTKPLFTIDYENYIQKNNQPLQLEYRSQDIGLYPRLQDSSPQKNVDPDFQNQLNKNHIQVAEMKSDGIVKAGGKALTKTCLRYTLDQDSGQVLVSSENDIDSFLKNLSPPRATLGVGDLCTDEKGRLVSFNNKSIYSTFIQTFSHFANYLYKNGLSLSELDQQEAGLHLTGLAGLIPDGKGALVGKEDRKAELLAKLFDRAKLSPEEYAVLKGQGQTIHYANTVLPFLKKQPEGSKATDEQIYQATQLLTNQFKDKDNPGQVDKKFRAIFMLTQAQPIGGVIPFAGGTLKFDAIMGVGKFGKVRQITFTTKEGVSIELVIKITGELPKEAKTSEPKAMESVSREGIEIIKDGDMDGIEIEGLADQKISEIDAMEALSKQPADSRFLPMLAGKNFGDGSTILIMPLLTKLPEEAPPEAKLADFTALLDSVEGFHKAGFIYRDYKVANTMVKPDKTPVFVDFGSTQKMKDETFGEGVEGSGSPITVAAGDLRLLSEMKKGEGGRQYIAENQEALAKSVELATFLRFNLERLVGSEKYQKFIEFQFREKSLLERVAGSKSIFQNLAKKILNPRRKFQKFAASSYFMDQEAFLLNLFDNDPLMNKQTFNDLRTIFPEIFPEGGTASRMLTVIEEFVTTPVTERIKDQKFSLPSLREQYQLILGSTVR
ncbi:MAG: hypothetical protein KA436_04370 [Oligoflexales bacterium]|nr:hypothetical protein [Oligoflexales bacterium]